jgi:hypothetical protein
MKPALLRVVLSHPFAKKGEWMGTVHSSQLVTGKIARMGPPLKGLKNQAGPSLGSG